MVKRYLFTEQTLNSGTGLLDLGCCGKPETMAKMTASDTIKQVGRIMMNETFLAFFWITGWKSYRALSCMYRES